MADEPEFGDPELSGLELLGLGLEVAPGSDPEPPEPIPEPEVVPLPWDDSVGELDGATVPVSYTHLTLPTKA